MYESKKETEEKNLNHIIVWLLKSNNFVVYCNCVSFHSNNFKLIKNARRNINGHLTTDLYYTQSIYFPKIATKMQYETPEKMD